MLVIISSTNKKIYHQLNKDNIALNIKESVWANLETAQLHIQKRNLMSYT